MTTAAYLSTQTIRAVVSTSQQNIRYSNPENNGRSDKPCAMPIVKGFSTAPEKPIWAATYTMHSPVMESYPIDMASGTMMMTKASVSSLIPNTEPKRLKRMICTPKVRHFWRCIFLWQRKDKNIENTRQNSNYLL